MSGPIIYKHDVFVSYSEVDRDWVRRELLPRLQKADLRVIDQSNFEIGVPMVVNAEQTIKDSHYMLIVMTPDWVASEWAEFEGLLISSMDPTARKHRLLPLLLRPCQLPARIAMLTPANFTNPATHEDEMKRLLRSLGSRLDAATEDQPFTTSPHSFTSPDPPNPVKPLHRLMQSADHLLGKPSARQRYMIYGVIASCLGILLITSMILMQPAPSPAFQPLCPVVKICILVAAFEPLNNPRATEFSAQVANQIESLLTKTDTKDFAVKRSLAVDNAEKAKQLARKEKAQLIVWGLVFQTSDPEKPRINVNFQVTDFFGIEEAQGSQPYRAQPLAYQAIGDYCTDCIDVEAKERVTRVIVVAQAVAGLVHYVQGRPEQARVDFQTALYCAGEPLDREKAGIPESTCKPSLPSTKWNPGLLYYYTGKALALRGDYKDAIEFLQQATQRNTEDPAAWIGIGAAYQSWLHQPDAPETVKALHQAETLARALPEKVKPALQPVVHYDLGLIYELLGNFANARQEYQQAADGFTGQGSNAYTALIGLARVQYAAHDPGAAIQTLNQARKLEEKLPWAYLDLARFQRADRRQAEALFQQADSVASAEAYIAITKAELCQYWKDYDCAATAYAQAKEKHSGSGWLYSKIGEFYLPTNPVLPHQDWENAQQYFRTVATDLRPQDPWAHERLAYVLFNQQAYLESIQEYQRTLELVHAQIEVPDIYCSLGRAQERSGLTNEAEQSYARCARFSVAKQLLSELGK